MKIPAFGINAVLACTLGFVSTARSACTVNQAAQSSNSFPALSGRLVYHAYLNYGDGSSNLYLVDFPAQTRSQLNTPAWNLSDPMNAQFSPDGKKLLFMARQAGNWHVFIWTIGSMNNPMNLTATLGGRNEDPKFSADGKHIVFKHEGDIRFATLTFRGPDVIGVSAWRAITGNGWATEESMPYPSPSGKYVLYTIGSATSSIYRINQQSGQTQLLTTTPTGAHDYYPVVRDLSSYFFTRSMPGSGVDQIMMMVPNISGSTAFALALNDCGSNNSDAAPVDEDYLIFSSSRFDGPYGLVIGDIGSGKVWRLNSTSVNVNDGRQKLGASYSAAR